MTIKTALRSSLTAFCLLSSALVLFSCQNGNKSGQKLGDDTVYVKGLYVHSEKLDSLRDCVDTSMVFFVKDETGTLAQRYDSLPAIKHTEEAVLVELKGIISKTTNDSIAKTLPKTLKVYEVRRMEHKNYQNVCIPYDFWALGSEPSWNLEISKSENLISFSDFNTQKAYRFNFKEPIINKDTTSWTYETRNKEERANIRITIRQQECSDTMTDTKYKFSAEILINGKSYKGCAISWK
ncbi:hypothetical protein C3K47_17355 [Solitalea longa]|uniref:Lipoprotein n=1 Tax=Solitalea longa TaxID=2079460 RepID=A0A2S4ZXD5_9SPHI|nr:hypothetical protein [Solitalea longa]POY35024.1 hypothetical protein C3K47_17355 [Solitalea longa]